MPIPTVAVEETPGLSGASQEEPGQARFARAPALTVSALGLYTPVGAGGSLCVGLWRAPLAVELSAMALGGGVGDVGGGVWSTSARVGLPYRIDQHFESPSGWAVVTPEVGVRIWDGVAPVGLAAVTVETAVVPQRHRVSFYANGGAGIEAPATYFRVPVLPEFCAQFGAAFW